MYMGQIANPTEQQFIAVRPRTGLHCFSSEGLSMRNEAISGPIVVILLAKPYSIARTPKCARVANMLKVMLVMMIIV